MVASISHVLTPGTPVYGLLKLGAIGSVVGLKVGLTRRDRRRAASQAQAPTETAVRRDPHPRSRKKKQRRRR